MRPDSKALSRARGLMLLSSLVQLPTALWALADPLGWHHGFPVEASPWLSRLGPFNDHITTDFAAALIGLSVVGLLAVRNGARESIRQASAGLVVFGLIHTAYHLTTIDAYTAAENVISIGGLVAPTAAAAWAWTLAASRERPQNGRMSPSR